MYFPLTKFAIGKENQPNIRYPAIPDRSSFKMSRIFGKFSIEYIHGHHFCLGLLTSFSSDSLESVEVSGLVQVLLALLGDPPLGLQFGARLSPLQDPTRHNYLKLYNQSQGAIGAISFNLSYFTGVNQGERDKDDVLPSRKQSFQRN